MFSLAPYCSLPELVLVRMYTFLVTMFGDPSANPKNSADPKNMACTSTSHIHIIHHHDHELLLL
jgi:hypothetical protein